MLIALDYAKDIKHIGVYFEEVEFNWTVGIYCGVCCVCYNGMFKALFEVKYYFDKLRRPLTVSAFVPYVGRASAWVLHIGRGYFGLSLIFGLFAITLFAH